MKNKKIFLLTGVILIILVITFFYLKNSLKSSNNTINSINMDLSIDDDDLKIDWSMYKTTSYELNESLTITDGGIYNLTGTISDGLITIDSKDNVKIILNNIDITNSKGPALYIKNANNVVIELSENSTNYLKDGQNYSNYEDDEIGTIFSHDDLIFQGTGTLEVISNNEDAIVSKDNLKIISGNYVITSKDDGIRGKDSVYIQNGTFTINSSGDGIKSTNDTDMDKGFVLIENGVFNIISTLDGISSKNKMLIKSGTFNIQTGNGSSNTSSKNSWGHWNNKTTNQQSAKGIKSGNNLVIENGTFDLDNSDDSIHCNSYIGIESGTFNISSGDDGIHADTELIIDGGKITINQSYEGLESAKITINNGEISIVSTDDGINVAGGKDSSSKSRPGENNFSSNDNILTINNGNIYVDAKGDGIDANGSVYMNGGNVIVYGPTDDGNGALDYDNIFEVNDGTLLAGGSSGMMQGVSSSSTQYSISINFNSSYSDNDIIKIIDSSSKEIISYQSNKSYSSLVVSSPMLKKGETYIVRINDSDYKTFTISSIITDIGTRGMPNGNRPRR